MSVLRTVFEDKSKAMASTLDSTLNGWLVALPRLVATLEAESSSTHVRYIAAATLGHLAKGDQMRASTVAGTKGALAALVAHYKRREYGFMDSKLALKWIAETSEANAAAVVEAGFTPGPKMSTRTPAEYKALQDSERIMKPIEDAVKAASELAKAKPIEAMYPVRNVKDLALQNSHPAEHRHLLRQALVDAGVVESLVLHMGRRDCGIDADAANALGALATTKGCEPHDRAAAVAAGSLHALGALANHQDGQAFGARDAVNALNAIAETEALANAVEQVLPLPPPPPKPKGLNAVGTTLLAIFCAPPPSDPPPYRCPLPPHEKTGKDEYKWVPEREDKASMQRLVLAAAGSNDAYAALAWLKNLKADWGVTKQIRVESYSEVPGAVAALATALEAFSEDVREDKMCSETCISGAQKFAALELETLAEAMAKDPRAALVMQSAIREGVLENLVELTTRTQSARSHAEQALKLLTASSEANAQLVAAATVAALQRACERVVPVFLAVVEEPYDGSDRQKEAVVAVRELASSSQAAAQAVLDAGVAPALVTFLTNCRGAHNQTTGEICLAIREVISKDAGRAAVFVEVGALPLLIAAEAKGTVRMIAEVTEANNAAIEGVTEEQVEAVKKVWEQNSAGKRP
ncbi:hypothetical protein CYMTET_32983 [Cymbomonas tetramitiformis]|uniref:Vacuolar protein 8 n=1 Tax=Cymbomonas tetramitiformis TaxID=36881 RepID=A0AAE0FDQ8_9CHLO|nr:hypothetical protein CYMTET_32983 [Cymbomonas tetramitiformis]|eukprot:gene25315-30904_t